MVEMKEGRSLLINSMISISINTEDLRSLIL
jgi:hypothetical protein